MKISLGEGLQDSFSRRHGSKGNEFSTLEDFGDRLNSFYTTVILLILVSITMTNVYFLRPISCTAPSAPSGGFGAYAESVCWVQGTIGLKRDDKLPTNETEWNELRQRADISFYQWVPFCLSIQAILFYIPHLIWQALSVFTLGDNLNYLIMCAQAATTSDDLATRSKLVHICAHHLHLLSRQHTDTRHSKLARFQHKVLDSTQCASLCVFGKRLGNRTAVLYLFVKCLYIANCLAQLFIVMRFLGPDSTSQSCLLAFSKRLFTFASRRQEWGGSDLFPLQTLCPIHIPNLGVRAQLYTAICALPVNMLNEKIYLFLWVWILAALMVSTITAGLWMLRLLSRSWGEAFLRSFLKTSLLASSSHPVADGQEDANLLPTANLGGEQLKAFLTRAVGCDGNFLIRMLRLNAGDVVAGEILVAWWQLFHGADEESSRQQTAADSYRQQRTRASYRRRSPPLLTPPLVAIRAALLAVSFTCHGLRCINVGINSTPATAMQLYNLTTQLPEVEMESQLTRFVCIQSRVVKQPLGR
ncbi:Innexin unc-7 [Taenia crassiceps]|uniref:Innexin n=1 Tax=Taenia crassiceps TaxID=6207 RepID=A0ABR4QC06_9CEST